MKRNVFLVTVDFAVMESRLLIDAVAASLW